VDEIVVSSEPVRQHVTRAMGLPAAKVRVVAPPEGTPNAGPGRPHVPPPSDLPAWSTDTPADWALLTDEIRRRAAAERARVFGEQA